MDRFTTKENVKAELIGCVYCPEYSNCYNMSCNEIYNALSKLRYYEDLEEQGNLVALPCKVGDTVYVLTSDSPTGIEKSRVKRMTVKELQDGTTLRIIVPCVFDDWGGAFREFYPSDFGKTIFLTKEKAEAALSNK